MKEIRMIIQCPFCSGTGVYVGLGEGEGTAVVCSTCKGRGWYEYVYNYNEFSGRKHKGDVNRVICRTMVIGWALEKLILRVLVK